MLYFSCSCGTGMDSTKSTPGHVMPNLCFASGRICGSRCTLRCVWGTNHRRTISLAWVGPVRIPETVHRDTLRQTCAFVSSGICKSYSGLLCIRGASQRIIFLARVGPPRIPQKHVGILYGKFAFLHLVVSASHVVRSDASRARNVNTLFFMLEWDWCCFHKKRIRTIYVELVFLHPVGHVGHVVHSGASGVPTLWHYFSCSCGTGTDSTRSALGHVTPNLCFASGRICGSRSSLRCFRGAKH
jgi:hypothetical protein